MNNIYLGDAYAQIDQIHDKWLALPWRKVA